MSHLNAETFYGQRAAEMYDLEDAGDGLFRKTSRAGRIDGQPVAVWAAAILCDVRDDGRATVAEWTDGERQLVPVLVREEVGRWIVDCPFCPSAQIAAETDPRFLCSDCLNAPVGGAYVATEWPA